MSLAKMATISASAALISSSLTNIQDAVTDPNKKKIIPKSEGSPLASPLISPMASPVSSPLNSPQVRRANGPQGLASPKLGQTPGWKRQGLQGEAGQQCFMGKKLTENF